MTLLDNISSVSIAESDGYGRVNDNYFATIDKGALTLEFQKVLKNAEGKKQKVHITKEKPDYDIVIDYENDGTHLLHLVLGGKGEKSRVMYVGNENNGFDITPEDTEVLSEMLENQ